MDKIQNALLFGIIAGLVNAFLLIMQGLYIDALIATFIAWVVIAIFTATSTSPIQGALRGIGIAIMILIAPTILIAWNAPMTLLSIFITILIFGAILGSFLGKNERDDKELEYVPRKKEKHNALF